MTARDVIAKVEKFYIRHGYMPLGDLMADRILSALSEAGYSIVHESEIHVATRDRCADLIKTFAVKRQTMLAVEYEVNAKHGGDATVDEFVPIIADHLSAALHALPDGGVE